METLSLEKFNPKKAELQELADKYLNLDIKDINDITGYKIVDEARKELKKQRVSIEKQGKEIRESAIKFQKDVIAYEKDLVAIIEPVELSLISKQDKIDLEKQKIELLSLLPDRKDRLSIIEIELSDDEILSMDIKSFEIFFLNKKSEFILEKERKENEEKRIKEIEERARIEAEEKAKKEIIEIEQRAEKERIEALRKAELEKQYIIDENNRKEKERIQVEENKIQDDQDKIRIEKENQEKLEKQKKYQQFLIYNNYDENTDYLLNKEDSVTLFRRVSKFVK